MTKREGQLEKQLAERDKKLAERDERLAMLEAENEFLRRKIDLLIRRVFGTKGERLDPAQLELLLTGEEPGKPDASGADGEPPEEAGPSAGRRRRRRREPRLPDDLPVLVTGIVVPDEVRADPDAWEKIGEDHQDLLDIIPATHYRQRTINEKYRHRTDRARPPLQAPMPPVPIPGTHCAPGYAAHLITAKYSDHLPHYRQADILSTRHSIHLGRGTLNRWTAAIAARLAPIAGAIRRETLAGNYLQIDETPIRHLAPGTGKAGQGYLWVYQNPRSNIVAYQWSETRGHENPLGWLTGAGFSGHIQCDGYSAYLTLSGKLPSIRLSACLAHIRRKVRDATDAAPRQAALLPDLISHLYSIERKLRRQRAGPALRHAVRSSESAPLYRRLEKVIAILRGRHLPQHPLRKALDYATAQWERQPGHLHHGHLEIDNNLAENAVRPTKLGMKNWLFFGSAGAGHMSAAIYTIVENCRRRGLNPEAYLRQVLEELPQNPTDEEAAALTPSAIAGKQNSRKSA